MKIRLDDLGASSKAYEWWSRHWWANMWPLHSRHLFGAWGPYRELSTDELNEILALVAARGAHMTLAVTACWVEYNGMAISYSEKFPRQAAAIRWWVDQGIASVAAHGMYHCVPGYHRPRWVGGNRPWHRDMDDDPLVTMHWLADDLKIPVTRYIRAGEPAGTTNEIVFHDRDFVLDWTGAMRKLHEALQ